MKKSSLLFLFFLFTSKFYCQDTIVTDNGSILSGLIVSSDSLFLNYKSNNSATDEINLIKRSTIILIKYGDGNLEKFFRNDTLLTKNGDELQVKILEVNSDMLSYFQYDGTINEAKIVPLSTLFMYKLSNGTKVVIPEKKSVLVDYSALGESDAKIYYKASKVGIAGQFVLGVLCWTGIGSIVGIILPLLPPNNLHSPLNPNDKLLDSNYDYKRAYEKAASNKKIVGFYAGFGAGALLPIGLITYASFYW